MRNRSQVDWLDFLFILYQNKVIILDFSFLNFTILCFSLLRLLLKIKLEIFILKFLDFYLVLHLVIFYTILILFLFNKFHILVEQRRLLWVRSTSHFQFEMNFLDGAFLTINWSYFFTIHRQQFVSMDSTEVFWYQ